QRLEARGVTTLGSTDPGALWPAGTHPAPPITTGDSGGALTLHQAPLGVASAGGPSPSRRLPAARRSVDLAPCCGRMDGSRIEGGSMIRVFCAIAVCGLALCSPALADGGGPDPGGMQGWTGVTAPGQQLRYVTLPGGRATVIASVSRSSGRVWGSRADAGS